MQKWEYLVASGLFGGEKTERRYMDLIEFDGKEFSLEDGLRTAGEDGWEMVGSGQAYTSSRYTLYFKRPKP